MAPPQAPVVPADPAYAGQAAAGAVMLAAVAAAPEKAAERHQQFICLGSGIRCPDPKHIARRYDGNACRTRG